MRPLLVLFLVAAGSLAVGCSSGPPPIKPGTPAFFWAVAKESYRTGDLATTDRTLLDLAENGEEFAAPARIWELVISAGLTQGFSELADAYESGSPHNPDNPLRFHNQAANLRSVAANDVLQFAQALHTLVGGETGPDIQLAFEFPPGPLRPPERFFEIADGTWPSEPDRDLVQTAMLERGVIEAVAGAVGSPDDLSQARAVFQAAEVRVPTETFIEGMARFLYAQSDLFAPQRMGRPDRVVLMCREAAHALESLPPNERRKKLIAKIQDTLKSAGGI
jgi:hypothetical protein